MDQAPALHQADPQGPLPRVVEGAPRQLPQQGGAHLGGQLRRARTDLDRKLTAAVHDLLQAVLAVRQEPGVQAVVEEEQLRQVREDAGDGAGRGDGEFDRQVVAGGVVAEPGDDPPDRPLPPGRRAGPGSRGVQPDGPVLGRRHRVPAFPSVASSEACRSVGGLLLRRMSVASSDVRRFVRCLWWPGRTPHRVRPGRCATGCRRRAPHGCGRYGGPCRRARPAGGRAATPASGRPAPARGWCSSCPGPPGSPPRGPGRPR